MAARLAMHCHVVLPDLPGYGDSSLPEAGSKHINFSFEAMPCGHYMREEMPEEICAHYTKFFK